MAIVIWAVLFSIQAAYRLRDETVGVMALHTAAERLRHGETEEAGETAEVGKRLAGQPFSWKEYHFQMKRTGNTITGQRVIADSDGGAWSITIEQAVSDPENFLRMITLLDREE